MKLGKLQEIDIREVWTHEQYDFSKWLSAEDNIQELGNVLNLSLSDIETEKFVGSYRCDILCRDEITGRVVLIENQLEQTNHDHLGKILTYASGWSLQPVTSTQVRLNGSTSIQMTAFLSSCLRSTLTESEIQNRLRSSKSLNSQTTSSKR